VEASVSQGIRIPKLLIEQANLQGRELELEVMNGGLFIAPINEARKGWAESISKVIDLHGEEPLDSEWIEAGLTANNELEW
jgi:antitoxin MazE